MGKKPETRKKRRMPMKIFRDKKKNNSENQEIIQLEALCPEFDSSKAETFEDFPISRKVKKTLKEAGFVVPTPIQKESIALALKGLDILGAAKTGSGKTLAFLIPVLECLYKEKWSRLDGLGALIITPTRELAYQIFEVLRKIGLHYDFSAGLIIGGKDLKFERKRLDSCNIMICTPGRLLQHMDENPLFNCHTLKVLVLDEADRILDLGFERTMNAIIENLPQQRQTLLFSATQTKSVKDLARLSLKDPVYVSVHEHAQHSTPENLRQSYIVCELHEKIDLLWSFLKHHLKQKILVFLSSCKQVKYIYEAFCRMRPGISISALYGSLHQMRRMAIYDDFCKKQHAVLFATDIAARGLDFPSVHWVIQLDCPEDANTYIHRVGRTARFEKNGEALLFLLPSEEKTMISQLTEKKIPVTLIKINPKKQRSVQRKIEALLARDIALKESAQRAFVSYLKSVFLMKNKDIFNIHKLNTDAFARSLGLATAPRIRFLQKHQKNLNAQKKQDNSIHSEDENSLEPTNLLSENEILETKKASNKQTYSFNIDDSDEELFTVTRRYIPEEVTDAEAKETAIDHPKKPQKIITKAAIAKKMLKKKIKPNFHKVFDDEGNEIIDVPKKQISEGLNKLAPEGGGINIEEAKLIMQKEDQYDKQFFKQRVKAMHKKQRLKEKEARKKEIEEQQLAVLDGSDVSSEENYNPHIEALPDPEKVYDQQSGDNVSEEETRTEDVSYQTEKSVSKKRKRKSSQESVKKKKEDPTCFDTGLSLMDDEELALHLLKYKT